MSLSPPRCVGYFAANDVMVEPASKLDSPPRVFSWSLERPPSPLQRQTPAQSHLSPGFLCAGAVRNAVGIQM
jgi:hypothetical protein